MKTIRFFLPVVVSVFALTVYAQDNKVSITLGKREYANPVLMGNGNFMMIIPKYKEPSRVQYYSADGKQLWEKSFKNGRLGLGTIAADPEGSSVTSLYYGNDFTRDKAEVTVISKEGDIRQFDLEGSKDFGRSLLAIFSDRKYLYYLAAGRDETAGKKKEDRLILNRFSNTDLSYTKFYLDLPEITDPENSVYWSFIGQHKEEKYLVSKTNDTDNSRHIFTVAVFDSNGKVVRNLEINLPLTDVYARPARTLYPRERSFEVVANGDISVVQSTSAGSVNTVYRPTVGAFSNLYLDEQRGFLYAYGLFGPKPFKRVAPQYEGIYVYKYDLKGKLIWKLEQQGSQELLDDGRFHIHLLPGQRHISLRVLPDETVNVDVQFWKSLFAFEVSPTGKFIKEHFSETLMEDMMRFVYRSPKLQSETFMDQNPSKKGGPYYSNFLTPSGEILISNNPKEDVTDILYFKSR